MARQTSKTPERKTPRIDDAPDPLAGKTAADLADMLREVGRARGKAAGRIPYKINPLRPAVLHAWQLALRLDPCLKSETTCEAPDTYEGRAGRIAAPDPETGLLSARLQRAANLLLAVLERMKRGDPDGGENAELLALAGLLDGGSAAGTAPPRPAAERLGATRNGQVAQTIRSLLAETLKRDDGLPGCRAVAAALDLGEASVRKTRAWQRYMALRREVSPGGRPDVVRLSARLRDTLGKSDPQLEELLADQRADDPGRGDPAAAGPDGQSLPDRLPPRRA